MSIVCSFFTLFKWVQKQYKTDVKVDIHLHCCVVENSSLSQESERTELVESSVSVSPATTSA